MIEKIKDKLITASIELNSNILTYSVSFWFGCSESFKIGDIELNQNLKYGFLGWDNGIKMKDLLLLEQQGFLTKISEVIDEQDPLEKTIQYEIKKEV